MLSRVDVLCVGDTATDAFIRLKDASVHCKINHSDCELCMRFGDKLPFEYVKIVRAVGNAANASVCAARLGLRSALVTNIGNDENGRECLQELRKNGVMTDYVRVHNGKSTNYHFVLWYESDRTILVNHIEYDYELPRIKTPKWIYLTSVAHNAYPYHIAIADYLDANPNVKLAFQPGTFQIKLGINELKRIYARTEVLVVNLEEAQRILKADTRDIKTLLAGIAGHGPKISIITDNTKGAYMYDGDRYYHVPIYPDPRPALERTGCGDAFSSTFVSALALGKTPLEALLWAPINPMSVAQFVGSQEGLMTHDQMDWWIRQAPTDYKISEMI